MKKTARNDVTGDWIQSKPNSEQFEKNFELIFGKKKVLEESIKDNEELYKNLAEYELDKSTGEVIKKED